MQRDTPPRVVVLGAGAMGSVYAGLLADGDAEVVAVTRNSQHCAAINEHGLRVEGASGDRRVQLHAVGSTAGLRADLVVVAVKANDIAAVAGQIAPMMHAETIVVALQNGLGSAELLAERIGSERLAVGIAGGFGARLVAPGHVYHSGMQRIRIGAYAGLDPTALEAVVEKWDAAGFSVEQANNIQVMQWEKLICNVAFSAPCTLTGLTVGEALNDAHIGPLSLNAAEEARTIALALGVEVQIPDCEAHVRKFASAVMGAKPSMLLDHEAMRPSEIDVINGAVPRQALKAGLTAPINATLTRLVKHRESAFAINR
ncbi:MAG: ketopantoate reductase family protein [Pseudomonadales bacterium]